MARAIKITAANARAVRWDKYHADPQRWFWSRVDRTNGDDQCWPWLGRTMKTRGGYGRLVFNGKSVGAHRMALALAKGEPHRSEDFACHSCDNPICCNPKHLWWGTPKDNVGDCIAKGRKLGAPRKIDVARCIELRNAGLFYSQIADVFGVNQASVAKCLKRATALRARSLPLQPGGE